MSAGTAHRESINRTNSAIIATENVTTAKGRSRFACFLLLGHFSCIFF